MARRRPGGAISTPSQGRQPAGQPPPPLQPPLPISDPRLVPPNPVGDATKPGTNRKRKRRNREILRRQRILRGSGYKIVVDGIWGPRSQRAWRHYLRTRSVVTIKNPQDHLDLTQPQAAPTVTNDRRAAAKERRAAERAKRQRERKKQIEAARQAVLNRAALLRRNPQAGRSMTLRDLTDVLVDKEVGYDPAKDRQLTKALQEHLRARGYKVGDNGVFGRITFKALKKAQRVEEQKLRRQQLDFIRQRLFDSGRVKAGDTPQWWGFGAIPEPEKLLKILQEGGFSAELMMKQLLKQALSPAAAWDAARAGQLFEIADTVMPGGAAAVTARVTGDPTSVPLWQYFADIMAITDLSPFGDYSMAAGYTEEERRRALQFRAKHKAVLEDNAQRLSGLHATVAALMKADSPRDFQAKFARAIEQEQKEFKKFQQRLASKDKSFWGSAVDAILWPSEQLADTIVAGTHNVSKAFTDPIGFITSPITALDDPAGADPYFMTAEEARKEIESWNPIVQFSFELLVDPLNLIAPARLVSTGAAIAAGSRGASLGRYVRAGQGMNKLLVYQKGTWDKRAFFESLIRADTDDVFDIANSRLGAKIEEIGRRLSVTKGEALGAVSDRLLQAAKFGYRTPKVKIAGRDFVPPKLGTGEAARLLDTTDAQIAQNLVESSFLKLLRSELKKNMGSLYLTAGRTKELSQYGTSLRAHLAETFRPMVAARLALERANDVYMSRLGVVDESEINDALRAAAAQEAQAIYVQTLRGFGTFVEGGVDKELREVEIADAVRDLPKELDERVGMLMDELERVVFPALQDDIERHADSIFDGLTAASKGVPDASPAVHPLWDAEGKWVGRHSSDVGELTAVIRKSFDEDELGIIPNPAYRRAHTDVEMRAAVKSELRRRLGRLNDYAARKVVGDMIPDEDKAIAALKHEEREAALEKEIKSHWDEGPDGNWYDLRPTLKVSNLYARHIDGFSKRRLVFEDDGTGIDFLATLGEAAPFDKWTRLEKDLYDFGAAMSGVFSSRLLGTEFLTPGLRGGEELIDEATQVRRAIDARMFALGEAEKAALPRLLLEQGAVWRAFQHAQSRKVALAYKGFSAQLALWKFATLALRPAWAIRNFLDNVAKALIAGVRDPRLFVIGPGKAIGSVFDNGIAQVLDFINYADSLFGTSAGRHFKEILDRVWELPAATLNRLFWMHNIEVPQEVFNMGLRQDIFEGKAKGLSLTRQPDMERLIELGLVEPSSRGKTVARSVAAKTADVGHRFANVAWHMLGDIPENYARAIVYRSEYAKALKEITESGAHLNKIDGEQITRVAVDDAKLREAVDRMIGKELSSKVDIDLTYVPMTHWEQPHAPSALFHPGHDGGGLIELFIPNDLPIRTRQEANLLVQWLANNLAHEARHAQQKRLAGRGKVSKLDFKVPYAIRPSEIDARIWARVRSDIGLEPFEVTNALPSELNSVDIQLLATDRAIEAVEKTLFDYSAISVAEDNLKIFFPFIQFWRKNSQFWVESFATKPWLTNAVLHFDDDRRDAHQDVPMWMQRYFHTDEITDALAVVPGLDEAFDLLGLGDGAMIDPISMTSMAPFYRAFKSENEFLPSEALGHKIFGPIIQGLNDWGLGINPLFLKPLEKAGIANSRAWMRVFPQSSLIEALAMAHPGELGNSLAFVAALPDRLLGADPQTLADNFDFYVQTIVAEQVARGEKPNLAAAEKVARDWFLTMNLWGYFGGMYWRRATPEDIYLAKLADDIHTGEQNFDSLTDAEKEQLKLWGMRGWNREMYDRYVGLMPVIEAYYKGDLEAKDEILRANPEIIRWVDGDYTGRPVSQKFVRRAQKYVETELFFDAMEIADTLDVAQDVREAVEGMFVSPELKKFWKAKDTPKRIQERMLQAEVRDYFRQLSRGYFAIPESDFEARDAYLNDHPELIRHWGVNNDPSDDYGAILGAAKADLRDTYFRIVEQEGFDGAADFLKLYPFMFEGTKAGEKIKDGEWMPGKGKWSAARIKDFREAKPHLTWFFDTFMPKVGTKQAFAWLEKTETEAGILVRDYLDKYPSSKRLDYLKAAPWLKVYFGMPPAERGAWLRGGSEGAQIVLSFFKKYGDEQSQHSKDYLSTKADLDYYFSLPKAGRDEWLKSDDPRAAKVLAYFKKYGKQHQYERAFKKLIAKYPALKNGTPEQAKRMEFWRQYFALTPEQRPMFVLQEAEKHGIFIYGEFGEKENYDREQEYMRRAVGMGLSEKQAAFLYAKPLLDFYRTLDGDEKALFVKANPELQWYFDKYSTSSPTGDKKLDKLVEKYFQLPADSFARSAFLRQHPEVQDWFDKRSSPAERAMRNLLEQYFALSLADRRDFLDLHPEISAWFDMRRAEKDEELAALRAFDRSDPRLRPFYEDAESMRAAAARMRFKLATASLRAMGLETRRDRRAA